MVFSVYDAKARLSELLRLVRARGEVVITQHGRPVARLVPYDDAEDEESLDDRLGRLTASGLLSRTTANSSGVRVPAGARSDGALRRFLEDRA